MKPVLRAMVCMGLLAALSGCVSGGSGGSAERNIQGTWTTSGSVAVYEIAMVDGIMTVKGHSSYSGKQLDIRDVSWDGKVLRFTSYMPTTDLKVIHENRLLNATTMRSRTEIRSRLDSVILGRTSHELVWRKTPAPE